ncbi:RagB/SusD family nutrient uptake outer membrane protein [Chryseobacterium fluminis]|uniref:RagB/SusD family nutrient uptake outer membrane protein n=1 Tax=Chryseobacterium fluminis TaxID=2983606 RepID=UPI00224DC777|nr:RagB/SusD family nutrient uptake outer membrane protein [Chryseobacterium sp. MMS21-Ot14]UZT96682.1 RagB/SusD family nutrient uptake outer membrane protein [Chryseobacterium sp. MMS21-Ot14]
MKRIINTVLILATLSAASVTMNSCQDAIDIVQPGQVGEDELFVSVANMNEFLIGSVYGSLDTNNEIYLGAVITDEVKPGSGSGGQEFQLHRYFLDPSEGLTGSIWLGHYFTINRINRLIEGATKITPNGTAETNQYNSILAQARAIRAFCYLQLESYFSTDMKNPNALGVMLVKDVPATDAQLPRVKNQDIYDFIKADLDYARGVLTANGTTQYYADKNFVSALSARFNLYIGNTALAKQYAQETINNSGLVLTTAMPIEGTNPYSGAVSGPFNQTLNVAQSSAWNIAFYGGTSTANGNGLNGSFNPYRNMWADRTRGEIVFALNRLPAGAGSSIGTRWNTNTSQVSGVPMWFLGRNLYNLINVPGDIRRWAYVDPSALPSTNYQNVSSTADRIVIDKYPGKTSAPTRNDLKIFRLSEMYFIVAEAEVAANNLTAAAAAVQQVRVARNFNGTAVTPAYTNTQIAYADILKERRVELALEGHRYIDLKRLATLAGVTMDRNAKDDIVAVTNLPNDSYKYTLPIPIQETAGNPNIQQNPGYY